jgi:hypothetical protein
MNENHIIKLDRSSRLVLFFLSITIIAFLAKYASEWTHEFLGHCGFGLLVGGVPIDFYVSFFWPIEFGYARVSVNGDISRVVMLIGGITSCFIAATLSNLYLYFWTKKRYSKEKSLSIGKLLVFHVIFWYGFWAFVNAVGYLIIGGISNFGDVGQISNITDIPGWIFSLIGAIAFFGFYYLISNNVYLIFQQIFPNRSIKTILSIFWLILPLLLIFLMLNPDIRNFISWWMIIVTVGLMFIPSLIMYFFYQKYGFPSYIS